MPRPRSGRDREWSSTSPRRSAAHSFRASQPRLTMAPTYPAPRVALVDAAAVASPFLASLTFNRPAHAFGRCVVRRRRVSQPSTDDVDHMRPTSIPRNHSAFTHYLHINASGGSATVLDHPKTDAAGAWREPAAAVASDRGLRQQNQIGRYGARRRATSAIRSCRQRLYFTTTVRCAIVFASIR
jgi:hypothetical protein